MRHITINGITAEYLPVMDRGLHYGDGLFETIACIDNHIQFWDEHIERMRSGAERLYIDTSAIDHFSTDVNTMLAQHKISNCVIKLILTRGQGERGYLSPSPQHPTRIVILSDLPKYPDTNNTSGIDTCYCSHTISRNRNLAGIKHLNRLDNVLARNEWHDEYQEGLMLDENENIVEGTMSNVFVVKQKQLFTPLLDDCGIDGIIRSQVLSIAQKYDIDTFVTDITKSDMTEMDEIFICNSLIGIWPVKSLADKNYHVGDITKKISQALKKRMQAQ
ncbi:MAG: aminodeoxychorismate lyase [Gammaproteobacteria bacterium]|nr:aminodeoxychorismate lyase [Gammaproteobacteria bacterium]